MNFIVCGGRFVSFNYSLLCLILWFNINFYWKTFLDWIQVSRRLKTDNFTLIVWDSGAVTKKFLHCLDIALEKREEVLNAVVLVTLIH